MPVRFGLSGDRLPEITRRRFRLYTRANVDVNPTTLSEYLGDEQVPMLVEHGRCGTNLGVHEVCVASGVGGRGYPDIQKTTHPRQPRRTPPGSPRPPGVRGPLTSPGVETGVGDVSGSRKWYARVWCTCQPKDHVEKISVEKLGSLPVTFPELEVGTADRPPRRHDLTPPVIVSRSGSNRR